MSVEDPRAYFDAIYGQGDDDPYGVRSRWYEQRKRAILLASLPRRHYGRVFEPACGIGELSLALATRSDHLLASDFNAQALRSAQRRLGNFAHVSLEERVMPQDFPFDQAPFDLIVLSEIGYFLQAAAWWSLAATCRRTLAPDGTLLACHWLGDFEQRTLPTVELHRQLGQGLQESARYQDADFELCVWSNGGMSVAQTQGIR